jgi:alkanesulfonate monooxygenase SsuD/methylene tetrahydromethanopterin reductase-like flavin-dependent oxidoreductase (luciferase family)
MDLQCAHEARASGEAVSVAPFGDPEAESICRVELGVHLPLMRFGEELLSLQRLQATVDAARACGFAAIAANDHFVFQTPWLDGPTALASTIERSGEMVLATTVSLAALRGPVPLAKALAAIDVLSEGRLVAALGPGSSERDYRILGIPFEERWKRFDEAVVLLRALLNGERMPEQPRYYPVTPDVELVPGPWQQDGLPLWIGSWGSRAGLARVARAGDGWLASAYNTTPERFSAARTDLAQALGDRGRDATRFPNALATMWTWVSKDRAEGDRVLANVLAPILRRDPDELRAQVCVGTAEHCAELLSRYAEAGCARVYLWPLGDEARQLELVAGTVTPQVRDL